MTAVDEPSSAVSEVEEPLADGERAHPAVAASWSDRVRALAPGAGLTVVAWFVCRGVVGVHWQQARNVFSLVPALWTRWDSFNYLKIAAHGTTAVHCPGRVALSPYHLQWCGTASWLPGYPWLIRIGHGLGIDPATAAVLISWLAIAAALYLVWWGWLRSLPWYQALALMVLFGVFPGAVYDFAIYPMSLALALMVGALLAATRRRPMTMALCMVGAGLCHPLAWFATAGLAAGLAFVALPEGARQSVKAALWGLAGLVSILVLGVVNQAATGHFDAYFLLARQADATSVSAGLRNVAETVFTRTSLAQHRLGAVDRSLLSVQAVIAMGIVGAASVAAIVRRTPAIVYPAFAAAGVTVGVLVSTAPSGWYRGIVLASPAVVCLRRMPLPVLGVVLAVVGFVTAQFSGSFFDGTLI